MNVKLWHLVKIFNHEAAYQLLDGFAVQNDYYTIASKIGGTMNKPSDPIVKFRGDLIAY